MALCCLTTSTTSSIHDVGSLFHDDDGLNSADRTTINRDLRSNKPRSLETQSSDDPIEFAYLIIHYHKTGHELSNSLVYQLKQQQLSNNSNIHLRKTNAPKSRWSINESSKCTDFALKPGTITVLASVELYCDVDVLADSLMHNPAEGEGRRKVGVKIIHLVRNPFSLMVSNYHYHAQFPTWVPMLCYLCLLPSLFACNLQT